MHPGLPTVVAVCSVLCGLHSHGYGNCSAVVVGMPTVVWCALPATPQDGPSAALCFGGVPVHTLVFIIVRNKGQIQLEHEALWFVAAFSSLERFVLQIQGSKRKVLPSAQKIFLLSFYSDFCTSEDRGWECWGSSQFSLGNSLWPFLVAMKDVKDEVPEWCLQCHEWPG